MGQEKGEKDTRGEKDTKGEKVSKGLGPNKLIN